MSVSAPSALLVESSLVMKKTNFARNFWQSGSGNFRKCWGWPTAIQDRGHCNSTLPTRTGAGTKKKGTTESKYKFLRYLPIISHLKICAPLWIFRHYSFIHSKIESIWKCFWNVHCALPAFLTTFIIWNIIRIFKYNLKAHQGMDMLWLPLFSAFGNNILTYLSIKPIQKCCF